MPRSNGIYTPPTGTTATTQTPISSSAYNAFVNDIVADQNNPRPVISGGTGAATAAQARANLGAIGQSEMQAEVQTAIPAAIQSATGKTTPVDADSVPLVDTEASNALKKLTWANIKAALASIFLPVAGGALTGKLGLKASTTSSASINIAGGTAPTTPIDGDLWLASDNLVARLDGASRTLYHSGNLPAATQEHAEGGTDTALRAWSALRVAQLVAAKAPASPVGLYTGTSANETDYPIGHTLLVSHTAAINRNFSMPIFYASGSQQYSLVTGTSLAGTWRIRGSVPAAASSAFAILAQRVA